MNKRFNKKTGVTLLVLLAVLSAMYATPVLAATEYPYHPEVKAYGTVQKDVYVGENVFDYVDDDGELANLPYERQPNNLTLTYSGFVFDDAFNNKTVSKGTNLISGNKFTLTKDVLTVNEQEYVYMKAVNSSALAPTTVYAISTTMTAPTLKQVAVDNEDYLFFQGKVKKTAETATAWKLKARIAFKDASAATKYIYIGISGGGSAAYSIPATTSTTNEYIRNGCDDTIFTMQYKIQDLFDKTGVSWTVTKIESIQYELAITTGATLDSSTTIEGYIYAAKVINEPMKVVTPNQEDNVALNETSCQFTYQDGELIDVLGSIDVTKIIDVSVPFVCEDSDWSDGSAVEDGKVKYIDALKGFSYEWLFRLPDTVEASADTLTYSGTNITLRSWIDGSFYKLFTSRGTDKLDYIDNKLVTTTASVLMDNRAWSYGVENSLTENTDYEVKLRVEGLSEDTILDLTEASSGIVWSFGGVWNWFQNKFWDVVIAVGSVIGFGAGYARAKKNGLRVPKITSVVLPYPMLMLPSASMPVMMSRRSNKLTEEGNKVSGNTILIALLMFIGSVALVLVNWYYPTVTLQTQYIAAPMVFGFILLMYDSIGG